MKVKNKQLNDYTDVKINFDNLSVISNADEYKEIREHLDESIREHLDEFNKTVDKRIVEIIRKWGEKTDIDELKTFDYSMPDFIIERIIKEYNIDLVVNGEYWNDMTALLVTGILPCQPEVVYVIKNGEIILVAEENK